MIVARNTPQPPTAVPSTSQEKRCFTIVCAGRPFGLPVERIQTVFEMSAVTPVPLSPYPILGLVNLRGKIVTAISLRRRLNVDPSAGEPSRMAVSLDHKNESFAVVVDEVGDVLTLDSKNEIDLSAHLGAEQAKFSSVHRLDDVILPILDLNWLFAFEAIHA